MFENIDTLLSYVRDATFIVGAIVAVFVSLLVFIRRGRIKFGNNVLDFGANVDLEAERIRRRIIEETPEASPAEKQFLLMSEYHAQGLAQSKISFWFSLIFASIGFFVIIVSIFMVNRESDFVEQGQAFVSLVAGTIIEAVSALFFVQSNRARQLMTDFFDRLRLIERWKNHLDSLMKCQMRLSRVGFKYC